jgi:hypothetical protein
MSGRSEAVENTKPDKTGKRRTIATVRDESRQCYHRHSDIRQFRPAEA